MNAHESEPASTTSERRSILPPPKPVEGIRKSRVFVALGIVAALGIGAVVYVKRANAPHAVAAAPSRDVPYVDGKWIRFSPEFASRSKIEFTKPEQSGLSPLVSVTGTVTFDPQKVAAIGTRITGRVRRLLKFPGDPVKAGEILADVESAELGQTQSAVLSARAHAEAANANERRETQLAEAHVSSQRDAELAKAAALAARAELFAAEQKVRAFGASVEGEVGILPLTSPISGKVVEAKISRGQTVEPSLTAFRVADLSRVWVELAVFERELGHIHRGDKVEISPQINAQMVVPGSVAHVGDVIDLETRSADVRVVVENKDESLRPGQSVLAKIHTATSPGAALLVPREAVTSVDGKPTVFVQHDQTSVEPRAVTLGAKDGKRVEIVSGLTAEETIVTSGVFALKSEVFR
jgi:cobalt-zinc-cadmium efflux system membrane fusion protein